MKVLSQRSPDRRVKPASGVDATPMCGRRRAGSAPFEESMSGHFLHNCWYVAAWGHELGAPGVDQSVDRVADREMLTRTLLNEPVVLFRSPEGVPVAMEDRCCHRNLPLSHGTLLPEGLQCGYHGFTYDMSGQCIRIPGQDSIPAQAQVRTYPVVERHRWIWIWMGDPELADPESIPDLWKNDHPVWAVSEGDLIHVRGHYQLVVDNLMDGSHVSFVHKTTLGTDDVADVPVETSVDGSDVRMVRWILDRPAAPLYAALGGFTENVDRWQIITAAAPSLVTVDMGSATAGTGAPEGDRRQGIELRSFNLITPETDSSCFYFYTHVRNFAQQDAAVTQKVKDQFRIAFLEDVDVIEGVQAGNDRFPDRPRADAAFDKAPLMARRMLEKLIAAEKRSVEITVDMSAEGAGDSQHADGRTAA